jgi:hypothetical protein
MRVAWALLLSAAAEEAWGGVASADAPGDEQCESARGGTFGYGPFSWTYDVQEDGCYRLDASAGAAECGFGSDKQLVEVDWCLGRYSAFAHPQQEGWTTLGYFHLLETHPPVQLRQASGPVDAFRFVYQGPECASEGGELAQLHVEADFDQIVDQEQFLQEAEELFPWARVLGTSKGSVVMELELKEEPTAEMVAASAEALCARVGAGELCAPSAQLRRPNNPVPPKPSPADYPRGSGSASRGSPATWYILGPIVGVILAVPFLLACINGYNSYRSRKLRAAVVTMPAQKTLAGSADVEQGQEVEEKKPTEIDDNASTATPQSLDRHLEADEQSIPEQSVA